MAANEFRSILFILPAMFKRRLRQKKAHRSPFRYLFKSHRISALVLTVLALSYFACRYNPQDRVQRVKIGVLGVYLIFLLIGALQFKNSIFRRPHPIVWRAVQASSIFYLLLLIFLAFQTREDIREWLGYVDSGLGVPLVERSYAEDCRICWETLWSQMDVFVVAHTVGWYVKALVIRDTLTCWILSVMFEVMEYTFQHQLPNFNECWWDHWILDVATCNALGIYLGMKTCAYLKCKEYKWSTGEQRRAEPGKGERDAALVHPSSGRKGAESKCAHGPIVREAEADKEKAQGELDYEDIEEHGFVTFPWVASTFRFKQYIGLLLLVSIVLVSELNAFYLKYIFWLEPAHPINVLRLLQHATMGLVSAREGYAYFSDSRIKRFGTQIWIAIACILTETLICIKCSDGLFPEPFPPAVKRFWLALSSILAAFPILRYVPWKRHLARPLLNKSRDR